MDDWKDSDSKYNLTIQLLLGTFFAERSSDDEKTWLSNSFTNYSTIFVGGDGKVHEYYQEQGVLSSGYTWGGCDVDEVAKVLCRGIIR